MCNLVIYTQVQAFRDTEYQRNRQRIAEIYNLIDRHRAELADRRSGNISGSIAVSSTAAFSGTMTLVAPTALMTSTSVASPSAFDD